MPSTSKVVESYLLKLYYLVFCKSYLENKSIQELISTIMYFWKIISTFYKNHLKKPKVMSPYLDSIPLMAKLIVKPTTKQKHVRSIKNLAK